MMRINRNSKGFTLIELLIVVAIIGILAAIAIPAYSGYTKKARLSGVAHAMGAVKNAICAYYTEHPEGKTVDADTVDKIKETYGVLPTTKYAGFAVTGGDAAATITATIAGMGTDLNGKTIIMSTTDFKEWKWSGDIGPEYMPKD